MTSHETSSPVTAETAELVPADVETLCSFGTLCLHRLTTETGTLFAVSASDDPDTNCYYETLPTALFDLFLEAIKDGNEIAHALYDFVAKAEQSAVLPALPEAALRAEMIH